MNADPYKTFFLSFSPVISADLTSNGDVGFSRFFIALLPDILCLLVILFYLNLTDILWGLSDFNELPWCFTAVW